MATGHASIHYIPATAQAPEEPPEDEYEYEYEYEYVEEESDSPEATVDEDESQEEAPQEEPDRFERLRALAVNRVGTQQPSPPHGSAQDAPNCSPYVGSRHIGPGAPPAPPRLPPRPPPLGHRSRSRARVKPA